MTKDQVIDKGVNELRAIAEEIDDNINDDLKISFADFLRATCDLLEALR